MLPLLLIHYAGKMNGDFVHPRSADPTEGMLSQYSINRWQQAFDPLSLNRFEGQALRAFFEEMGYLLGAQNSLDDLRRECATSPMTGWPSPNEEQIPTFYNRTKIYYDTFYSALSHLSSVVVRFSRVFGGRTFMDNARFVAWLKRRDVLPYEVGGSTDWTFNLLERARLFRALLNHPQQFPVIDWSTESSNIYRVPRVVLHGPASRSGAVPVGSSKIMHSYLEGDWRFEAPQESSVTNSLGNVSVTILAEIIVDRSPGSAFAVRDQRIIQTHQYLMQTPNSRS